MRVALGQVPAPKDVEVIQVVRTTLLRRGEGKTEADPVRRITQFWTLEGDLLAEVDPHAERERVS